MHLSGPDHSALGNKYKQAFLASYVNMLLQPVVEFFYANELIWFIWLIIRSMVLNQKSRKDKITEILKLYYMSNVGWFPRYIPSNMLSLPMTIQQCY